MPVAGKPLIDHVLDRLAAAGVERAVVNVHYLADLIERHLKGRTAPQIVISDEREKLLDTGGGVVKALGAIGSEPFIHVNSDTIWIDGVKPNLERLAEAFDPAAHGRAAAAGAGFDQHRLFRPRRFHHGGRWPAARGAPSARSRRSSMPGAAILRPELFKDAPDGAFSLTTLFDRAAAAGRLHGLRLEGVWMHVGTPEAIAEAEAAIAASAA